MARLGRVDASRLEAITVELDTLRLHAPSAIPTVLPAMSELLATEGVALYSPTDRSGGWEIERWHSVGIPQRMETLCRAYMASSPGRLVVYDPACPEPAQRNRVLDGRWLAKVLPGTLEASAYYRNVLVPLRMTHYDQFRALICEGPALLAWFGGLQPTPVESHQRQLLQR